MTRQQIVTVVFLLAGAVISGLAMVAADILWEISGDAKE